MHPGSNSATILVVEDDGVLGHVLAQILSREGYVVRHARSAEQALGLLKDWLPQLILLDVCLRDGRGLELAQTVRASYPDVPVILLTAYPLNESDFGDWPPTRLLTKSTDLPDLRRAVAAALSESNWRPPVNADPIQLRPPVSAESTNMLPSPAKRGPEPGQRIVKERAMRLHLSKSLKIVGGLLAAALLVAGFVAANGAHFPGSATADETSTATPANSSKPADSVKLVEGKAHTLFVPEDVRKALGISKDGVDVIAVAKKPTRVRPLEMPGSTLLDPTRLYRIRARFAPSPSSAEVVEIAQVREDPLHSGQPESTFREIRSGDKVIKGDLLAVFYSVDVGNKKNDLIDAIYQLDLDKAILKRAEKDEAVVPEIYMLNARKAVQSDQNAVDRALATLRTWGIPETDIKSVLDEAQNVIKNKGKKDKSKEALWPRVEMRAPADGVIVERTLALHEIIVDNTTNLFQIANVDRLFVTANCPEDELPALEALPTSLRKWTVKTAGTTDMKGYIDDISYLIDPNQHTAVVKGHIDNKDEKLRAGQFIRATVEFPPPQDVVEVPIDSVIDDGQQCVVFLQTDAKQQYYTMRRVQITNRFDKTVFVRSTPFAKEEENTPEEAELGLLPKEPLLPGDRLLQSGVGELKSVLIDRESRGANKTAG